MGGWIDKWMDDVVKEFSKGWMNEWMDVHKKFNRRWMGYSI